MVFTRRIWTTGLILTLLVAGAAFIGAGLASFYGDRLWIRSYRVIPPDGIRHSAASKVLSALSGAVGGGLILLALLLSLHVI